MRRGKVLDKEPDLGVWSLKPMPSSRWGIGRFYLSESKCTVSARILHGHTGCTGGFSVQNTTKDAEITTQKITLFCVKNNDGSKLPSFETNPRLALLISGPRVRVPGGAPPDAEWDRPCCPEPPASPLPSRWYAPAWTFWGCPREPGF